ncbi:hypothetical protein LTR56_027383 [Elasticomyces elasticus]|nr:hypothetical protein LTR56_027383 [Elasticomyces elasticus]KAK4902469.1 hypothetical protein LTR49_027017 [Elasticomyces elasticus]KAK5736970.1 hypothetical protein LTS12_026029 [Elasticomyces elasticus]
MTSARSTTNPANVNIIGLYGIPGSGKSTFIKQLGVVLNTDNLHLREGSEVIEGIVPGGLETFNTLTSAEKTMYREQSITKIRDECVQSGKTVVVAGHLMFWNDAQQTAPDPVYTRQDLETYTHILYLDTDPNIVAQRRRDDRGRARPELSVGHLRKWQEEEKRRLRQLCYENSIIFSCIVDASVPYKMPMDRMRPFAVLQDCWKSCETLNKTIAAQKLDNVVAKNHSLVETMLVFDADKTLAPVDTGEIFFMGAKDEPLKTLFQTSGYTYTAFRQATLLYEEAMTDNAFEATCEQIATKISICDEILNLLQAVDQHNHVGMVIMTCGLRLVWDKVLARAGLSTAIPVIGGGRITDGYVVTPDTKADLVARLKDHHGLRVVAFGDSEMDLPMLKRADQAVIVVGDEVTRSKSMDGHLRHAILQSGLQVHQTLVAGSSTSRLLGLPEEPPLINLWKQHTIASFTKRHLPIFDATESTAAKLLQTAMRDAKIFGPALREAHRRAGHYLATAYLTDVIGLEECPINHVQGTRTLGHRLLDEQRTTIVPLMRGGEPMAFGVSEVFPLAMFVHAKKMEDLAAGHLRDQSMVILVDAVINTGHSIVEFVERVRELKPGIQIVVVAGVIQADTVKPGGTIRKLALEGNLSVVALRLSENSYKGHKATDTGDRLFNTTEVD